MTASVSNQAIPHTNPVLAGGGRANPPTVVGLNFEEDDLATFSKLAGDVTQLIGRPIVSNVLHRWAVVGCRGVRLNYVQTPRGRMSSMRAVEDFFYRLTAATSCAESGEVYVQSPQGDQRSFGCVRQGIVAGT
jgi:hypothetical protein